MVYRVYVEKRPGFNQAAAAVAADLRTAPGVEGLTKLRLFNRYDVEGVDEALFRSCLPTVFSEPPVDAVCNELPQTEGCRVFAVEYLPGQFDQRADAAAACIALISGRARPAVRTAAVYMLFGTLSEAAFAAAKKHLINPVEAREAQLAPYESLVLAHPEPGPVPVLTGFTALTDAALAGLIPAYGLAMDLDDLKLIRAYFSKRRRDPTLTELKVLDTYWSDHCRHTTFQTVIDDIVFSDPRAEKAYARYRALRESLGVTKPVTLMDMGTIGARYLRSVGKLDRLDSSPEINACTVRVTIDADGKKEPWLMLFKNETHNHPTEIEPFGGAATCIGGAIRDPLSGRAYVYQAMRITGAADPRTPLQDTLPGKLSQRKLTASAAAGYSSYGNQIGLATGLVREIYHAGYAAKRMEVGAVVGAVPESHVRREEPLPGDVVLLLGGKTGRDGCGGATGSSKAHTGASLVTCSAEVQKGNAPEERKLQRLFRSKAASRLIKRCNDFGAGGVSVAIGELADGLTIDLDAIPKKYDGLDGTELAISESQERMAVVVAPGDAEAFIALANAENLMATRVATVTKEPSLVMTWRGQSIVALSRAFIDTNGAEKHVRVEVEAPRAAAACQVSGFAAAMEAMVSDLNVCSQRGLTERFDSTVGAGTVLMPLGGKRQRTPVQAMAAKFPVESGRTDACSYMSWGFDPVISAASPYDGGYLAVIHAAARLVAAGAPLDDCYLSFQEYFPRPGRDAKRFGLPAAALLGALDAQLGLELAAIGGKDSMSGSFETLDVPPTLIAFAVAAGSLKTAVSPEFKRAGSRVALLTPACGACGLPEAASMRALLDSVIELCHKGHVRAGFATGRFGIAEAVYHMALGNGLGFAFDAAFGVKDVFRPLTGAIVLELDEACDAGVTLGFVTDDGRLRCGGETVSVEALEARSESVLSGVFPADAPAEAAMPEIPAYPGGGTVARPAVRVQRPRLLIPVFPGTNCEYESARAAGRAGFSVKTFVVNTLSPAGAEDSIRAFAAALARSDVLFLPGGFSNGDEPDGSGKFITAFLRSPRISDAVEELLNARMGLALGVCNGFQALIKLGLLPYGHITAPTPDAPTLTHNLIGRHQSSLCRTRVYSRLSPWLALADPEAIYTVPVSHGEGRFVIAPALLEALIQNGQIATRYVGLDGAPSMAIGINPNGSAAAIEGVTSPDGRIFGKMGHSERIGDGLYQNVPGRYDMRLFESAMRYFQ